MLVDDGFQCERLGIIGMDKPQWALALADTDNYFLVPFTSENSLSLEFAADIRFVYFNNPAKLRYIARSHGLTDAVIQIPCGFVSADAEVAL